MRKKYQEEIEKMQIITTISPMTTKAELLGLHGRLVGETPMLEGLYVGTTKSVGLLSLNGLEVMQRRPW